MCMADTLLVQIDKYVLLREQAVKDVLQKLVTKQPIKKKKLSGKKYFEESKNVSSVSLKFPI